jgi:hypothetical protein
MSEKSLLVKLNIFRLKMILIFSSWNFFYFEFRILTLIFVLFIFLFIKLRMRMKIGLSRIYVDGCHEKKRNTSCIEEDEGRD